MTPIILSGNELGLGVVRSLGMMNIKSVVIYNNQNEIARVSRYVAKAFRCPLWSNYQAVKDFLIDIKDDIKGGLIIPTEDLQVEILAKYKEELSKFYTIPVPDYEIVKLFLDKKETYKIAKKAGINFPVTFYPKSMEEALINSQYMRFPLMIKPRDRGKFLNIFKKKLFIINNEIDLKRKLCLCLKYNIKIMITEIIPGPDTQLYEYDFYVNKSGESVAGLGHVKLRQAPPNFGIGRVIKTIVNREIEKLTERFLECMPGFFGPGQLEFKLDPRDKKYKLIEMNGRITLQGELYAKAGINFAYLYYQEWNNNKLSKIDDYIEDLYWIYLPHDIIYSILSHKEENYTFAEYIKPYIRKHIFHIESLSDPIPMIFFWAQKVRNLSSFIRKNRL